MSPVSVSPADSCEIRPVTAFDHEPVLLSQVIELFRAVSPKSIVDGTLGGGGHAFAILDAFPECRLIGIDRDPSARDAAAQKLDSFRERVTIHSGTFSDFPLVLNTLGLVRVDGLLVDLGVSSHQLDQFSRGFSFRADGPLDMRMDPTGGRTAADLIAEVDVDELADILWRYGEERQSRRFARAIKSALPTRTGQLSQLIERLTPAAKGPIHPATRTFQALRIAVNDELGELERWLSTLPEHLNPNGVAVVISFHSLEDRMVKQAFRALTEPEARSKFLPEDEVEKGFELVFRGAVSADGDEVRRNPRARSAKLRALRRKGDGQ